MGLIYLHQPLTQLGVTNISAALFMALAHQAYSYILMIIKVSDLFIDLCVYVLIDMSLVSVSIIIYVYSHNFRFKKEN